ncbi:MAG: M48 family metalloprotease [Aestuariivita sp.]|nr:M48 family metalloprotease [Aestuariivita sp.]
MVVYISFFSASSASTKELLRDADIENALNQLATPILSAANLERHDIKILVVDDQAINAFIINNRAIFINYGLILKASTPEMLQAVIAHEAAHIANGHIPRRTESVRNAQSLSRFGIALAIAAGVAAGPDVATGLAIGTSGSSWRNFLKHTRAEEAAADQTALIYMQKAKVDPNGMVELHQLIRSQESLSESRQDPYMRSHPLTKNRIRAAKTMVDLNNTEIQPNPHAQYWFARLRGKLSAFKEPPKRTLKQINKEKYDDVQNMRKAVAYHRQSKTKDAINAIDAAISIRNNKDGFYFELKGQILLESRKLKNALTAYREAQKIEPDNSQILAGLGRAELASGEYQTASETLKRAHAQDHNDTRILRDLGQAYANQGKIGLASLVTAELYEILGRLADANIQAKRALNLLPEGSANWLRAQDIFVATKKFKKKG